MVHAGCVFVTGIHLSRAWMSGSFESLQWNAFMHRLDLGLYSHPKEFWGNGVRAHVISKGKIPSTGSPEEDRTHSASSRRTYSGPNTLPTELFQPLFFSVFSFNQQKWSFWEWCFACIDQTRGRNSSVGNAWARCPQRRGFDPPLGTFSVEGIFPLELTWVQTPFPPILLRMRV